MGGTTQRFLVARAGQVARLLAMALGGLQEVSDGWAMGIGSVQQNKRWFSLGQGEGERERDTLVYFSTLNLLLSMVKCTNQLENSCFWWQVSN